MIIESQSNNPIFESNSLNHSQEKFKRPDEMRERIFLSTSEVFQQKSAEDIQEDVEAIEENSELELCWEGIDLEEDELLLESLEEEEIALGDEEVAQSEEERAKSGEVKIDIKEEVAIVVEEVVEKNEEVVVQEDEMEKGLEVTARLEEEDSQQEKHIEEQLSHQGERIEQESALELDEGNQKTLVGNETIEQVNIRIEQEVDPKVIENNENMMIIENSIRQTDNFIHLNQSFIHQHNGSSDEHFLNGIEPSNNNVIFDADDNIHTMDDKSERITSIIQANSDKLDELGSKKMIHSEAIHDAIKSRLRAESFEDVCDENGVPLYEDVEGINQLTRDIVDDQEDYPEERMSQIIDRCVEQWLKNKNLHTKNSRGELIPITEERRRELTIILSRGIVIQIVYQMTQPAKASKEEKIDDSDAFAQHLVENARQQPYFQIHGQKFNLDSLDSIGSSFKKMVPNKAVTNKIHPKSLEDSNKEIIDLSERISQTVIFKEMIKGRMQKDEIEHLDEKHVIVAIDRLRLQKLKKINGMARERHENMFSEMETSADKLKGKVYA